MGRNDFRFFPLSHQDLHVLSWLTPYTKVWSIVSTIELIATIILGCKLIERIRKNGIDLSNYDVLYQEHPSREYARIFRHR